MEGRALRAGRGGPGWRCGAADDGLGRVTPLQPPRARTRARGLVVGAVLALGLSGCSGPGDVLGGGPPDDASIKDFCGAFDGLTEALLGSLDLGATEREQAGAVVDVLQGWAADLEKVGTPADIPDAAREGFEVLIETAQDLPDDASISDLEALEGELSGSDREAVEAFTGYASDTCPSALPGLPSGAPSDLPSDLPSDFGTDLPSEPPAESPAS